MLLLDKFRKNILLRSMFKIGHICQAYQIGLELAIKGIPFKESDSEDKNQKMARVIGYEVGLLKLESTNSEV